MKRCSRCLMPTTRPDVPFTGDVCQACINYQRRPQIDWAARREALVQLLDRHHGDVLVPSSGGKDSCYIAMTLKAMGANVTAITASTCYLTEIGRLNIDNLARHVNTIEVSPNKTVRAKLNRLGLQLVGDISFPEHVAIFTMPFNMAEYLGATLIFYGENPQDQYGGPLGSEDALTMTRRWRSEFGGFLGLRPSDLVGKDGITAKDMEPYQLIYDGAKTEAHFLGQYLPWDSHQNAIVATEAGMKWDLPTPSNWWPWENLDNAMTGLHDWFMYLKFGYGRGCAQASVDIRHGGIWRDGNLVWRDAALAWVWENDGMFPTTYAGVGFDEVLDRIGMAESELLELKHRFTTKELFTTDEFPDVMPHRPQLREERP